MENLLTTPRPTRFALAFQRLQTFLPHPMKTLATVFNFYLDGFRNMTLGKTLWTLILVKLFVMFAILKVFFFPNFLNSRFDTPEQKSDYVSEKLTTTPAAFTPFHPAPTHPTTTNP